MCAFVLTRGDPLGCAAGKFDFLHIVATNRATQQCVAHNLSISHFKRVCRVLLLLLYFISPSSSVGRATTKWRVVGSSPTLESGELNAGHDPSTSAHSSAIIGTTHRNRYRAQPDRSTSLITLGRKGCALLKQFRSQMYGSDFVRLN